MNQRIQELADQCQFELHGINGEFLTSGFDTEKFAELIIKETMKVVAKNISWNGYLNAADAVIAHFESK